MDTLANSTFGQIVNHLSHQKLFVSSEYKQEFVVPEKYLDCSPKPSSHAGKEKQLNDTDRQTGDESSRSLQDQIDNYIVVDWYDEHDQENPLNWSLRKRLWVLFSALCLTFTTYVATSIFMPGIPDMTRDLNTTHVKAILPFTTFVLVYGIGPMFLSPLSEYAPLGRTYIYIVTYFIFVLLQIPTALASTIEQIIGLRLLAGIFAAPSISTVGATIGDIVPSEYLYAGLLFYAFAGYSAPSCGPLIGGIVTQLIDWRWTFWMECIISGICFVVFCFLLPETNAQTILHRRAKRLRKITGNAFIKSPHEINSILNPSTARDTVIETLWRPIFLAFGEPIVFFLNVYSAFLYIVLNAWFEAFLIVFTDLYHFNLIETGVTYLTSIIGCILGGTFYFFWIRNMSNGKVPEIERYLEPAMFGSFLLPIGLFIFSWGASTFSHWIAPAIGALIFCAGAVNIFQSTFNYLGGGFNRYIASVFAGNCLMRSWAGAVFPVFITPMFTNLGSKNFPVGAGGSVLGGVSLLMIAIPFVIGRYGVKLRARSRYASS